jgi:hypothetical protein
MELRIRRLVRPSVRASHKPFAIMRQRLLLLMSPTHTLNSSSVASAAFSRSSGKPTAPQGGRSHRSHTDEARQVPAIRQPMGVYQVPGAW